MHALQIEPIQQTLAMALMYYGGVARLPPLFEVFDLRRSDAYKGDYGRFGGWLADWVGRRAGAHQEFCGCLPTRRRKLGVEW